MWQDHKLYLTYRLLPLALEVEQLVDPYGLVAKAGVWYLVYAISGCIRSHRVSALFNVRMSKESFERPADFDLTAFWKEWCAEREKSRSFYTVTVRVAPDFLPELARYFGDRIRVKIVQAGPPDAEGWITLELSFESLEAARDRILGFGRGVEVLEPQALRRSVLDFASQIVALYTH